jgi:CP family cyanate transporter-like MFS transporter
MTDFRHRSLDPNDPQGAVVGQGIDRSAVTTMTTARSGVARMALLAAGLLLIALNLRIGIASVGPVLDSIERDLKMSSSVAGLLTAIPVVAFGMFAFLTPQLTRAIGLHRLLGLTMLAVAVGLLMRAQPSLASLFAYDRRRGGHRHCQRAHSGGH